MKFYETHFEDYCKSVEKYPFLPANFADVPRNLIFYGSVGTGKYSRVLTYLQPFSPSQMKYDKKIKATTDKQSYKYRISDIHYEVDMALLGCNSKIIWHEIYCQIVDIITIKPDKMGFIVCKNFHAIHNELLEIFYSYMQQHCYGYDGKSREVQIYFILITEHVSFLPNSILNHCDIVRVPRPSVTDILQSCHTNKHKEVEPILEQISVNDITNIKEVYSFSLVKSLDDLPKDHFNKVCDIIIQEMTKMIPPEDDLGRVPITQFRDYLYDILIYNLDGIECIWYIFQHFLESGQLRDHLKICGLMTRLATILKQYGNNYRSIFHIEHAIFAILEVLVS
jgi:hypothetical protein